MGLTWVGIQKNRKQNKQKNKLQSSQKPRKLFPKFLILVGKKNISFSETETEFSRKNKLKT